MIRVKENGLFEEWKQQRPGFVADGVVDEHAYKLAATKILFVLKEVSDPDGGGWDLRDFVREGGRPQPWDNISRWTHGIRNLSHLPEWEFYKEIDNNFRVEMLRSICAINLKKSPAGHPGDNGPFLDVVQRDRDYLKRQLSLYTPDLVVCCGTGEMFQTVVAGGGEEPEMKTTSRGIPHFSWNGVPVLAFLPTEARVPANILMYALVDAVKEILHGKGAA